MLELILVCTVFAMLVSGIILAINRTYVFLNNTKVEIRATNLARESMEMMFNIRDTNRRKCSGEKDKFWLYLGSGANNSTNPDNEDKCVTDGKVFEKGVYTIKEGKKNGTGDKFIYAEKLDVDDVEEFYKLEGFFTGTDSAESLRQKAKVTFTGTYMYLSGSAATGEVLTGQIGDLLGNGVEFYRVVRVYGIYCKTDDVNQEVDGSHCNKASDPKEMRFCVKVFYKLGVGIHSSELCSIMTNFME